MNNSPFKKFDVQMTVWKGNRKLLTVKSAKGFQIPRNLLIVEIESKKMEALFIC